MDETEGTIVGHAGIPEIVRRIPDITVMQIYGIILPSSNDVLLTLIRGLFVLTLIRGLFVLGVK